MTVYDFSSGFNLLGQGIDSLSAAQQAQQKRNALASIGDALQRGDYKGAASGLLQSGDVSNGIAALKVAKDADAATQWTNGPAATPAATGSATTATDNTAAGSTPVVASGGSTGIGPLPNLLPTVQKTTQQYGLDPSYVATTLAMESAGGRNLGSRGNPGQFDQGTANEIGMPDAATDPNASVVGTGALAAKRAPELANRIGRAPTPAETYLAHQQGTGGAAALLNADPDTKAADLLGLGVVKANLPPALQDQAPTMPAQAFANYQTSRWNSIARSLGYTPGNSVFASADQGGAPQQISPAAQQAAVAPQQQPAGASGQIVAAPVAGGGNGQPGYLTPVQRSAVSTIPTQGPQAGQLPAVGVQIASAAPGFAPQGQGQPQAQPQARPAPQLSAAPPDNPVMINGKQWTRASAAADDSDDSPEVADVAKAQGVPWIAGVDDDDAGHVAPNWQQLMGQQPSGQAAPGAQPQATGAPGAIVAPAAQPMAQPQAQAAPAVDKSLGIVQAGGLPAWLVQGIAATKPGTPERLGALQKAAGIAAAASSNVPGAAAAKNVLDAAVKAETDQANATRILSPTEIQQMGLPALPKGEVYQADGGKVTVLDTRDTDATEYTAITDAQKKLYPGAVAVDNTGKPLYPPQGQTINVDTKGEGAEAQESGKLAATRRGDLINAADKAPDNISRLQLLGNVLAATQSGQFAGPLATASGFANAIGLSPDAITNLGLKPDAATNADIAGKLAGELVMGSIGAKNGGFPASNFSVAERQFIEKTFPSLQNQPGANQAVTDVLIAREQRVLQKADEWSAFKDQQRAAGKTPSFEDFEDQFRRAHAGENIFAPIQAKFEQGGYGPVGSPPPTPLPDTNSKAGLQGTAQTQQPAQAQPLAMPQAGARMAGRDGSTYLFKGGDPKDPNSWVQVPAGAQQ